MGMKIAARNYLHLPSRVPFWTVAIMMMVANYLGIAICRRPGSARANPLSRVANDICRADFSTAKFAMVYPYARMAVNSK